MKKQRATTLSVGLKLHFSKLPLVRYIRMFMHMVGSKNDFKFAFDNSYYSFE